MTDVAPRIRVTVNGQVQELPAGLTVRGLLEHFGVDARHTAVERNRQLVPRAGFDQTPVADGDLLEIVTLVGGG